ncbi:MAG: protease inhibitor I42 family protein [Vitreimonas sp.]
MRTWIIAAFLAFTAAPAFAEALPPPVPEDVSVQVTGPSGSSVDVQQGENFSVSLQSSPSTGARWVVTEKPDFIDAAGMRNGPVNAPAANGRPMLGAPVWNVFLFTANAAGSGTLTLELHGPGGQIWQTFTATINAQ